MWHWELEVGGGVLLSKIVGFVAMLIEGRDARTSRLNNLSSVLTALGC